MLIGLARNPYLKHDILMELKQQQVRAHLCFRREFKRIFYFHILTIYLFILLFSNTIWAEDLDYMVAKIQKRYQSISSFSGKFIQVSHRFDEDSITIKAEGTLSYLRPGKMRWDYKFPEEQLLITDGKTLWLYDPLLENVTVHELSGVTEGTALDFLLGAGDLRDDFRPRPVSRQLLKVISGVLVELEPRKNLANLDFIQLEVHSDSFHLKTLLLMDRQGNYRSITLHSMQYNLPLEPDTFTFDILEGMEVLEAEK